MPSLTIDNLEIQVPEGTKVIEAAERLGIMIPRFCYHPALGSVGACRMCAVKFEEGPVKGLDMSCMVDAEDGMVISSTHPEVVAFRKWIIECLMMNHPHDCPVCDEGGHCLLQDETVSGGHGLRRYMGRKRTYSDQYLGGFVQHEMNRCIQCWRCRRFYQEFAGYRDLGALGIANHTYFGRFSEGALSNPFSGNLIDICPTGVFTDKPSRFEGRRWDLQRAPSLCLHCSLGCNTVGAARYREMVRLEARFNERVNGHFICDRGRYGFKYTDHPDRPRQAQVNGEKVTYEEALRKAAEGLNRIHESMGGQAVACLGSPRNSLETQGRLVGLCLDQGWPEPWFFMNPSVATKTRSAVSRLDGALAISMKGIEEADLIVVAGADPVNEAPMLALSMRQARRKGAEVVVMDPRPVALPMDFDHLAVPPSLLNSCLAELIRRTVPRETAERLGPDALGFFDALSGISLEDRGLEEDLLRLAARLKESRKPVIVCGTDIVPEDTPARAADLALLLKTAKGEAGLFYVLQGANAFGATLLSSRNGHRGNLIEGLEQGSIKALILVENDPFAGFPDRDRLTQALEELDLLIALDYVSSPAVERAHVVLPTLAIFETRAHYVNQEGRLQTAWPIHGGGTPISQIGGGGHPPRMHLDHVPGGAPGEASRILTDLAARLSGDGTARQYNDLRLRLAGGTPLLRDVLAREGDEQPIRLLPGRSLEEPSFSKVWISKEDREPGDSFELLLVDWLFGTEELSSYSPHTRRAECSPCLILHAKDAESLGLSSGDKVVLHLEKGPLQTEVDIRENMAQGVMVLPRHRQLEWRKVARLSMTVPRNLVERL